MYLKTVQISSYECLVLWGKLVSDNIGALRSPNNGVWRWAEVLRSDYPPRQRFGASQKGTEIFAPGRFSGVEIPRSPIDRFCVYGKNGRSECAHISLHAHTHKPQNHANSSPIGRIRLKFITQMPHTRIQVGVRVRFLLLSIFTRNIESCELPQIGRMYLVSIVRGSVPKLFL